MMEQVEARSPRGHMWPVLKALTSLFALVALLVMPLGMSGASAAAAAPASQGLAAAPCDEHGGKETAPAEAEQHCATCMAVPVAGVAQAPVALLPKAPRSMASATPFLGLEPEVSTPPPKDV